MRGALRAFHERQETGETGPRARTKVQRDGTRAVGAAEVEVVMQRTRNR